MDNNFEFYTFSPYYKPESIEKCLWHMSTVLLVFLKPGFQKNEIKIEHIQTFQRYSRNFGEKYIVF
jgi:hypothetical protein